MGHRPRQMGGGHRRRFGPRTSAHKSSRLGPVGVGGKISRHHRRSIVFGDGWRHVNEGTPQNCLDNEGLQLTRKLLEDHGRELRCIRASVSSSEREACRSVSTRTQGSPSAFSTTTAQCAVGHVSSLIFDWQMTIVFLFWLSGFLPFCFSGFRP